MKSLMIKFICLFFPKALIRFLIKHKHVKQHPFTVTSLIHRNRQKILFEVEFNWYDNELLPVSIVREVKTGKIISISYYELLEFKEYLGADRNAGDTINTYGKEK